MRRLRPSRVFIASFILFFGLTACWSLAMPMFASPDEASHLVKAAATVRGEIRGEQGFIEQGMAQGPSWQPARWYRVPAAYAAAQFPCYTFNPLATPACENSAPEHPPSPTGSLTAYTTAGHYNPLYYALVGWPSLVFKGVDGMYVLRLASALINSLLLAGAVTIAAGWRRCGPLLAGLVLAVTPMVLFLNGTVNPNGLEVASATLAWVTALSLALQPARELLRRRMITLIVAGAVLVNVRPLGCEWLVAILAVSLLVAERETVRAVLRCRTARYASAASAPAYVFAIWWTLNNGDDAKVPYVPGSAFIPAAHTTFDGIQWYVQCMIGEIAALTPSPMITYDLWISVVLLMAFAAIAFGHWRQKAATVLTGVGIVVIPVLAQGIEAKHVGFIWQGRYLLAFAAGFPILAGAVLSTRAGDVEVPRWVERRVLLTLSTALAFADFAAYFRAVRRYTVGLNGRLLLEPITWEPPGTWVLWVPLYAVLLALFVAYVTNLATRPDAELSETTSRHRTASMRYA